ncbi:MAG: hypothetical protein J0G32_02850 [Alphaproteobacteria bacterium]|nr:hypothetical protein [Alphaproteobacteria bacterium]OJV12105.1 MAG: hypothetical protein BGO27_05130 [Alphaproteobacteria bacterium 33-17]
MKRSASNLSDNEQPALKKRKILHNIPAQDKILIDIFTNTAVSYSVTEVEQLLNFRTISKMHKDIVNKLIIAEMNNISKGKEPSFNAIGKVALRNFHKKICSMYNEDLSKPAEKKAIEKILNELKVAKRTIKPYHLDNMYDEVFLLWHNYILTRYPHFFSETTGGDNPHAFQLENNLSEKLNLIACHIQGFTLTEEYLVSILNGKGDKYEMADDDYDYEEEYLHDVYKTKVNINKAFIWDEDIKISDKVTLLEIAHHYNNQDAIRLLSKHGAKHWNPKLGIAIQFSNPDLFRYLFKHFNFNNDQIESAVTKINSPTFITTQSLTQYVYCLQYLHYAGHDVIKIANKHGKLPLFYAFKFASHENIKHLIAMGFDINQSLPNAEHSLDNMLYAKGTTPFMTYNIKCLLDPSTGIYDEKIKDFYVMIEQGLDLTAKDANGNRAFEHFIAYETKNMNLKDYKTITNFIKMVLDETIRQELKKGVKLADIISRNSVTDFLKENFAREFELLQNKIKPVVSTAPKLMQDAINKPNAVTTTEVQNDYLVRLWRDIEAADAILKKAQRDLGL